MQQSVEMNSSEFDEDNATILLQWDSEYDEFDKLRNALERCFVYLTMVLGIPGNILSAIVWLRLLVAKKNSSAVYLAAIAINDLAFLLSDIAYTFFLELIRPYPYVFTLSWFVVIFEPLLILGFSVERLLAIRWPLQVDLHYR